MSQVACPVYKNAGLTSTARTAHFMIESMDLITRSPDSRHVVQSDGMKSFRLPSFSCCVILALVPKNLSLFVVNLYIEWL